MSIKRICAYQGCKKEIKNSNNKYCSRKCYLMTIKKKKSFKERVDDYIKGSFFIHFYSLFTVLMLGFAFFIIIFGYYEPIKKTLELNSVTLGFLFWFIYGYALFLILRNVIIENSKNKLKHKKIYIFFKKKLNFYFLLALFLLGILLILSFSVYTLYYANKFPMNARIYPSPNEDIKVEIKKSIESISNFKCMSRKHYTDYVEGDDLYCVITFNYKENSSYILKEIEVQQYMHPDFFNKNQYYGEPVGNNKTYSFDLGNLTEGFNSFFIGFYFINISKNQEGFYDTTLPINAIPKEEYYSRQREKIPIFMAMLSVILFSLFAGIKNLKDLIENSK